ncbi:hypothetical protein MTR10_10355 [Staphylococcus agnetis]|uniref:hypothetical protein n=1 Tax=Staphylococcus agnetis TaxID=985762 RepID=UPI00208E9D8D|nr:hypothetical protein [Staphylococcus agnetis]MCO4339553.1 hypothetical protein [Staphylococcus agnetis]MCO4346483.1 hypothetical protein [Staphylococcus agnetis]MCO4348293.1 hypothetical protein [Staphylococcus agnetis]MCO4355985.1 hypothetical protein [Staphylococcus agnetis]MCO4360778.1 hypothetical protein [Staphylococcus agnetis]
MKLKYVTAIFLSSSLLLAACSNDETSKENAHEVQKSHQTNKVYDKLSDKDITKKGSTATTKTKDVTFVLGNHDRILQVKKDLSDMPINKQQEEKKLEGYAKAYMEDDTKLKKVKSETQKVYYSEKINREYFVTYQLDTNGNVTEILISSYK